MALAWWFAALLTVLPIRSDADDVIAACERVFRRTPDDYEAARCFLQAGHDRARAITALDRLRESHPEATYLVVVRAHFKRVSNPDEALEDYEHAARTFADRNLAEGEIIARANRRSLLVEHGRYEEARREVDRIEAIGRESPDPVVWARAEVVAASHEIRLHADVGAAYARLLRVEQRADLRVPYAIERELMISRAGAALLLLEFGRAKSDYRHLATIAEQRGDQSTVAIGRYGLAYAHQVEQELHPTGDTAELERLFLDAIEAARGVEVGLEAQSLESLALVLAADPSRVSDALRHLARCMEMSMKVDLPDLRGMCHLVRSQVLARQHPQAALKDAQSGLELLSKSDQLWQRVAAWRHVMRRTWEQRPAPEALIVSDAALATIEHLRHAQRDQVGRRQLFATWTLDYYWLSSRLLERQDEHPDFLNKGFTVMERARARVLLDHLVGKPSSTMDGQAASTPEVTELTGLQRQLLRESDEGRRAQLLERIESLELQVSLQESEPLSEASDFASIADIQQRIAPEEALIAYQIGPSRAMDGETVGGSWAIVVLRNEAWSVRLPWDREHTASAVRVIRGLVARRDGSEHDATEALRRQLFEPVSSRLPRSVERLVVVPDGPLYGVPLSVLLPGVAISVVPSATVWLHLRNRAEPAEEPRALAMVDPEVVEDQPSRTLLALRSSPELQALELGRLPESVREGRALRHALALHDMHVMRGREATEDNLTARWSNNHNLLHLAAHAVIDPEHPERSAIVLAPGAGGRDGLLQPREIVGMPFAGATVVLSGCATGWGASLPGEGVLSLARSFHQAGARAVIASLWPVRDDEAASLFEHFYTHVGNGDPLDVALVQAQRDLARAGAPASAHAGFVLIGDGATRFQKRDRVAGVPVALALGMVGLGAIGLGIRHFRRRVRAPYRNQDPRRHKPRS